MAKRDWHQGLLGSSERREWKRPGQTERWLRARVTPAEQLAIKILCLELGIEVSSFVRRAVFRAVGEDVFARALREAKIILNGPAILSSPHKGLVRPSLPKRTSPVSDPDLDF